jgi:hypothetical protein
MPRPRLSSVERRKRAVERTNHWRQRVASQPSTQLNSQTIEEASASTHRFIASNLSLSQESPIPNQVTRQTQSRALFDASSNHAKSGSSTIPRQGSVESSGGNERQAREENIIHDQDDNELVVNNLRLVALLATGGTVLIIY